MVIGTALNLGTLSTVALSVALAFVFGYSLTTLPARNPRIIETVDPRIAFARSPAAAVRSKRMDGLAGETNDRREHGDKRSSG